MPTVQRSNVVTVALVAALAIPRIEKWTGVKLTIDDVAALCSLVIAGWHAGATIFEHYFPPKVPFPKPVEPAS